MTFQIQDCEFKIVAQRVICRNRNLSYFIFVTFFTRIYHSHSADFLSLSELILHSSRHSCLFPWVLFYKWLQYVLSSGESGTHSPQSCTAKDCHMSADVAAATCNGTMLSEPLEVKLGVLPRATSSQLAAIQKSTHKFVFWVLSSEPPHSSNTS